MTDPVYDDEEVREILRRALEEREGLGHDELAAAAAEVGIDSDRFERAAKAVRGERSRASAIERRRGKRRGRLMRSGATFAVINLFLFAVDLLTGGGWWFHWPLISMALVYALQMIRHFSVDDEAAVIRDEARRAKQLRKRNRKERRRANAQERHARRRSRKQRLSRAEAAFEDAVETGVAHLLESLASGLEAAARPRRRGGEFADFVDRKEGRERPAAAAPKGATPPPRQSPAVRVEAERDEEMEEALAELERELER